MADDAMVAWNSMSWGYWGYRPVPVVSKYKWIEPRHMVNVCERWAQNRTDGLQAAFFNGVGYESWENVWGIWNQLTPRDAEALRRIAMIERADGRSLGQPRLAAAHPHVLQREEGRLCQPFSRPQRRRSGCWSTAAARTSRAISSTCPPRPRRDITTCGGGVELKPKVAGQTATLAFEIEGHGFGAVLAMDDSPQAEKLDALLGAHGPAGRYPLGQSLVAVEAASAAHRSHGATKPSPQTPEGMVLIPGGKFRFKVSGVEIEGDDAGVDFQYAWDGFPPSSPRA